MVPCTVSIIFLGKWTTTFAIRWFPITYTTFHSRELPLSAPNRKAVAAIVKLIAQAPRTYSAPWYNLLRRGACKRISEHRVPSKGCAGPRQIG
ncbi:hypothetical protein M514_13289 [Trichuris suis]|uniref:Uncharacterized protein n=2 Tax=Trichuris suis TaxID=68888 RepID=A0A085MRZ8_9BILA|nr:hypothetical protein M514_13289 [Trichuris suis]